MEIVTRSDARVAGLQFYYTGKSCKRGHVCNRYTSTSVCYMCASADGKSLRSGKADLYTEQNRQWYAKNRAKVRARAKLYYTENRDELIERTRQWRAKNPHKVSKNNRIRNTRLEQAIPPWFEEDKVKTIYLKRDELNAALGTDLQVDHIIPLNPRDKSVCGLHCWANLQLLEQSLNDSKKDSYHTDW